MSQAPTIEDRLSALEKEMTQVKRLLLANGDKSDWLEKVSGSFANDPEFDEVLRLGAEIRRNTRRP